MQVTDGASCKPSELKVDQTRWMRDLHPLRPNSHEFALAKYVTDLDVLHDVSSDYSITFVRTMRNTG